MRLGVHPPFHPTSPGANFAQTGNFFSESHRGRALLRRRVSVLCLLLLAAVETSAAQVVVRPDTVRLGWGTLSGAWSATNGSSTFMGTWTALPDTTHDTVIGTWTLADARGTTLAFGGWSAAKAATQWIGTWRANVTGRSGEFTGTWSSSVDLKANARFVDLFATAARTVVSGTWESGERSGAWSIRAAK